MPRTIDQERITSHGKSLFSEFFYGLFSSAYDSLEMMAETFIREQGKKALQMLGVAAAFLVGSFFLLSALALYISEYLGTGSWVGHAIVGAALMILALIFKR